VVADEAAFIALQDQWNETVARAHVPNPFMRHEWFRTWWECFGSGRRLHLVIVRNAADRIVAIAPLMLEQVHLYGLPIRKVDLLHNDHTPRTDFIVAESASAAYEAIWAHLDAMRSQWDLLQLSRLPADSVTLGAIGGLARRDGRAIGMWHGDVSPYLTLSGTWQNYYASLSAKFRSNLRNRLTRLTRFGEPRLEILEEAGAIADARADALRLEASGWKAESGTSICSDASIERFYTLLSERATASGWLRLMFLTVGGRRIATSYGSRFDRRLFLFKTGYDPEYATCSPFKLLTYFAIQSAYDEGLSELDFLGDAEPWKLEWTETTRSHDWMFVFSDSVRARLLHSLKFQVVPELKRWRA
jgi:CelD/BcsL family acetyltransferase involved in cellulose biosynthesis